MKVDEALKRFRSAYNLSAREVSETLGILPPAYSRYETGRYVPRADDIVKLAAKYRVSADYLLGISDDPTPADDSLLMAVKSCQTLLSDALANHGGNRNGDIQDK